MNKKEKQYEYDLSRILTEDFDEYLPEKEVRRQKWKERRKKDP